MGVTGKLAMSDRQIIVVFLLALALRALFIILVPYVPWSDAVFYDTLGWRLAQGFGYTWPSGEPTAYTPPLYPLALAGMYTLFGHSVLLARLLNVFCDSFTAILIYLVVVELYRDGDKLPGNTPFVAGLLYAINPITVYSSGVMMTEPLFITLFMSVLLLCMDNKRKCSQPDIAEGIGSSVWQYVAIGILGAMAALTRFSVTPFWCLLLVFSTWRLRLFNQARAVLISAAFFAIAVSPWVLRNWLVSGHATFDTHSAYMLYSGTVYMGPLFTAGAVSPPFEGISEWEQGPVGLQYLTDFVRTHPLKYLWYTLRRAGHMLDLNVETFILAFSNLTYGGQFTRVSAYLLDHPLVIPLALLPMAQSVIWIGGGIVGLYSRFALPCRHLILAIVVLWVGSHAIMTGFPRYFIPMLPFLTIPLSHLIVCVKEGSFGDVVSDRKNRKLDNVSDMIITGIIILAGSTWITTGLSLISRL